MGVKIVETGLRDGHQSLFATRMNTEEVLCALKELDQVGYHAIEIWGGATFDACLRFLNEDPWERLRLAKKVCKKTKLQMLFRGQNILGYRHYADDVVEKFVEKSIKNGIDIIRIFDALNDIRNLECAVKATKKYGGECQIALSYTTSPVHTVEYYVNLAKEIEKMGADSICIKDMAGVMMPTAAYELISALKKNTKLPIELHSHCTGGLCEMTYLKAIEAGVDIVDCAISPLSGGTSQPCTESLNFALQGTEYDPKIHAGCGCHECLRGGACRQWEAHHERRGCCMRSGCRPECPAGCLPHGQCGSRIHHTPLHAGASGAARHQRIFHARGRRDACFLKQY